MAEWVGRQLAGRLYSSDVIDGRGWGFSGERWDEITVLKSRAIIWDLDGG